MPRLSRVLHGAHIPSLRSVSSLLSSAMAEHGLTHGWSPRSRPRLALLQSGFCAAIFFSALLTAPLTARAADVLGVETRAEAAGVYSMTAHVILNARPIAVRSVLMRQCGMYRTRVPHLQFCREFKVEGPRLWLYALLDVPVLNKRDYTVVSTVDEDLRPDGTGTYRTHWNLANAEGPPPRGNSLRLKVNEGGWVITPYGKDGAQSEAYYRIRCAPGGFIPSQAAAFVVKRILPGDMRALEKIALEEQKNQSMLVPVPGRPFDGIAVQALGESLMPRGGGAGKPRPTAAPSAR